MNTDGRKRVIIENVSPAVEGGLYPVKRVAGELVVVSADIFCDGHDQISALLLYRAGSESRWKTIPMRHLVNDRWEAEFRVEELGNYYYTIQAWVDHFKTWRTDLRKRIEASQEVKTDLLIGADLVEKAAKRAHGDDAKQLWDWARFFKSGKNAIEIALSDELSAMMDRYPDRNHMSEWDQKLAVAVTRKRAMFSSWYELFPRSCAAVKGKHGTFKDCEKFLPEIAARGFDILYLPPIHSIGERGRKGRDGAAVAEPKDPGSPWAIGSRHGGHKSVHPELGTLADFERFVKKAGEHGLEIALDLSFQCSCEHPYVKEHPEWFKWRPDGSIQFAENPPKKYEDIIPFNFETENWQGLWEELKSIVLFWIDKGILIFRVDNPHTKPFAFWEWLIREIKKDHPEVIFLAEAFTRPKVMYRLAKVGFDQSYTYFTWRNTKHEFVEYLTELTQTDVREFFRPNFWPNTPDILPEFLQYGGRPAFVIRLVLAATLSSNYGIYGPAFELIENQALPGKEEYRDSEKYEIRTWDWNRPGNLRDFITRLNQIRRENRAFQTTNNLRICEIDNDHLVFCVKKTEDLSNIVLVVVNLDPFHPQAGRLKVPIWELGIPPDQPFMVYDLVSSDKYIWQGEWNYVALNPGISPAHIFRVHRLLRREDNFDYFM